MPDPAGPFGSRWQVAVALPVATPVLLRRYIITMSTPRFGVKIARLLFILWTLAAMEQPFSLHLCVRLSAYPPGSGIQLDGTFLVAFRFISSQWARFSAYLFMYLNYLVR